MIKVFRLSYPLVKIRGLVLESISKEVAMSGGHGVSSGTQMRGKLVVSWSRVSIRSVVHVLGRVPVVSHSSIEVLVSGNISSTGPMSDAICMSDAIGTGSFGLRFCNFCRPLLVSLCLL